MILKKAVVLREVFANVRSLKAIANLCAHEGISDEDGLHICLVDLTVILKWFVHYLVETQR